MAFDFYPLANSKIMPFEEAADICGRFGLLFAYLNDPKRWHPGLERTVPFSLPFQQLPYSKERIQTALAINIAGLTVELAIGPSDRMKEHLERALSRDPRPTDLQGRDSIEQVKYLLHCTCFCSGDLAFFTREPIYLTFDNSTPKGVRERFSSEFIYAEWRETCASSFEQAWRGRPQGVNESELCFVLTDYWQKIDASIPEFLSEPVLVSIRET